MKSEIKSSPCRLENINESSQSGVESKIESARSDLKSSNELLRIQMRKITKDLIRWMFIFSLATVIITLVGFYLFLKLLLH